MTRWIRQGKRAGRGLLVVCGLLFGVQVLLPFTRWQGRWGGWLAAAGHGLDGSPAYIVALGGGGIPSESGFIRVWHAANAARDYPEATIVVALPTDEDPENSSVGRMKQELVLRGVSSDRILLATEGLNTHQQAVQVAVLLGEDALDDPVLIVTSPYHLRRAILCFRKAGFRRVGGRAATSTGAEADFGGWMFLRYGLWQAWADQPTYLREMVALLQYRLRGWI